MHEGTPATDGSTTRAAGHPQYGSHRATHEPPTISLVLLFAVSLGAGVLSGVVGTGSSIILLPILVWLYGPKAAVPAMAIASVLANLARVIAWWRSINWRAVLAYSIPGMPAAALGAHPGSVSLAEPFWAQKPQARSRCTSVRSRHSTRWGRSPLTSSSEDSQLERLSCWERSLANSLSYAYQPRGSTELSMPY
jgi:hypothetical protein